ncbi:MAG TPA: hypothetical protein QGF58_06770 [Myxococcota bacterium]|nr:hypothetical protein [Myxococcota bacterium]
MLFAPLLAAVSPACAPKQLGRASGPERHYEIEVFAEFDTTGEGIDLSGYEHQQVHLRGHLLLVTTRAFRDGSEGDMLRFESLEHAPSAEGPWVRSELSGMSVELRVFDTGEILAVRDAEHLAGAPRHGEVFDVLLPALSPVVPAVRPGDESWRRTSWPFEVGYQRGWRNNLTALWKNEGIEDVELGRSAHLSYAGQLEGEGSDARMEAEVTIGGEVAGEVWMRTSDARLVRHELDWTRTVHASYSSGVELEQAQHFVVSARLVEVP